MALLQIRFDMLLRRSACTIAINGLWLLMTLAPFALSSATAREEACHCARSVQCIQLIGNLDPPPIQNRRPRRGRERRATYIAELRIAWAA